MPGAGAPYFGGTCHDSLLSFGETGTGTSQKRICVFRRGCCIAACAAVDRTESNLIWTQRASSPSCSTSGAREQQVASEPKIG
jgi:hypothetical protein